MQNVIYPFTALVGQERMRRALVLNAVSPQIGGVLIRGERGTAKSTAARALAALLPQIKIVTDCRFSCDPDHPDAWCDECRVRHEHGEELPVSERRIRLVNLPVSATEDRVVGTLDIEKAIQEGKRYFDAGVLAAANRGILYMDEVNLLDDHVVDLLLDSAAMGVNVVEREGISFTHPARFILIGTMNPEEGDLRPQLLDRFALCVDVHGIATSAERMAILERHLQFEQDPPTFCEKWMADETRLTEEIGRGRDLLDQVEFSRQDMATIANLTSSLQVEGHRADLVILKTARAHAAFEGRTAVEERDILLAAELALPHRIRRGPFQEAQVSLSNIEERLEQARSDADQSEMTDEESENSSTEVKKKMTQR
jgi:Mg-chelatase subunit ChlI